MTLSASLRPLLRIELSIGGPRDVFASAAGRSLGHPLSSLDDLVRAVADEHATTARAIVQGGGGALEVVPLGIRGSAWEEAPFKGIRLAPYAGADALRGASLTADARVAALIDADGRRIPLE